MQMLCVGDWKVKENALFERGKARGKKKPDKMKYQ